jgi:protein phosphatase
LDKIAIISDVHGNMPALEPVLADIKARGIETIFNLGDVSGKGPHPAEAVDSCREICEATVIGNWESFLCNPDNHPKFRHITDYYREKLGEERLDWLKNLPACIDFWMSGKFVRLYHASHISEWHRIFAFEPYETYIEMFQNTEFTGYDNPCPDVVGYGDIHAASINSLYRDHKILFNAGSVGNPLDIPMATYAILTGKRDSQTLAPFNIELVRIPYDIEATVRAARDVQMPDDLEQYIVEIRTAVHRTRQS